MGKIDKTIPGSTLIEVLVAMVIIMTSTGIGLMIYENLSNGNNDELKVKAEISLDNLATETKLDKHYIDFSIDKDDMQLIQSIESYDKSSRLKILHLEAKTPFGKKITQWNEVILIP